MDNDLMKMFSIIERELNNKNSDILFKDLLYELIDLLKQNDSIERELKYKTLVELFKFMKFGNTHISLDPRGERSAKYSALKPIVDAVKKEELGQHIVDNLKQINELCLSYILDPLKLNKEELKFSLEKPGAKF